MFSYTTTHCGFINFSLRINEDCGHLDNLDNKQIDDIIYHLLTLSRGNSFINKQYNNIKDELFKYGFEHTESNVLKLLEVFFPVLLENLDSNIEILCKANHVEYDFFTIHIGIDTQHINTFLSYIKEEYINKGKGLNVIFTVNGSNFFHFEEIKYLDENLQVQRNLISES